MIRNFRLRTAVLLFVLMAFSVSAHAYQGTTFNLRIEDPITHMGRVITDNVAAGFGNSNGDKNNTTPGSIYWSGYLDTAHQYFVQILATSSTTNADGSGGGVLTLSAHVQNTVNSSGQILITLEDSGYFPTPTAPFTGVVQGYNYSGGPNSEGSVTPQGTLTGGATSVNLQAWLNSANSDPNFGADSGWTSMSPLTLSVPTANDGTNFMAYDAGGETFGTTGFSYTSAGVPVNFSGAYSIFSQATVNFSGSGAADFTLIGDPAANGSSVPEPTTLVLLGSALFGFGVLRWKKHI